MSSNHRGSVLIVDDDPEFRVVAQNLIELEGFAARVAASGAEALRLCDKRSFEVILLDLMLGDAFGMDVLREIRKRVPTLPVIVITAHCSMESVAEAVRAEAFDYLGKPFRAT